MLICCQTDYCCSYPNLPHPTIFVVAVFPQEEPKKVRFDYDLFLHLEGHPPVNHLRCEKLTFNNPTEEFRRKLLKAGGVGTSRAETFFSQQIIVCPFLTEPQIPLKDVLLCQNCSNVSVTGPHGGAVGRAAPHVQPLLIQRHQKCLTCSETSALASSSDQNL